MHTTREAPTMRANKRSRLTLAEEQTILGYYVKWLEGHYGSIDQALNVMQESEGWTVAKETFVKVGRSNGQPSKTQFQNGQTINSEALNRRLSSPLIQKDRQAARLIRLENFLATLRLELESELPTEDPRILNLLLRLYALEREV